MIAEQQDALIKELLRCQIWIEGALQYSGDTHDFKHIVDGVMSGHMQLWPGENGCAVTEINVYPKKKILNVFLAGGQMEQILDFQKSAEQYAKLNGCSGLSLNGRVGWKKVLKDYGWTEASSVLVKEI